MIQFARGDSDGTCVFELTERHADEFAVFLGLPLVRTRTDAGIIVTIQPRELTNGSEIGRFEEGRGDSSEQYSCFECEANNGG